MRKMTFLFISLGLLLAASEARAGEQNALMGLGMVGPAQYDQGDVKLVVAANVTGLAHVGNSVSLGGLGLALRATYDLDRLFAHFDDYELGLAVPFVTYRRGRTVAQIGAEIQRVNLHKNLYYMAVGLGFGRRNKPDAEPPRAAVDGVSEPGRRSGISTKAPGSPQF